jgi:hypothetical protein
VRLLRGLAALAFSVAALAPALADEASRAAKMVELVENVNLPFVQRLFITLIEETRREMPTKFVEGIGVGAKLGERWKPGNAYFDRARDRIEARIAESERQGRLEPPGRREIAQVLKASWTEEDLDFLVAYVKTDAGKQLLEFMDTLMVPALRQTLARNSGAPPAFAARTEEVARQADERFRAISPTVVRGMQAAKSETSRAMALTKLLDSKSGEVVGQLWANKVVGEILAIGRDELLTISRTVDEFRRAEGLAAPAAAPPPSRL